MPNPLQVIGPHRPQLLHQSREQSTVGDNKLTTVHPPKLLSMAACRSTVRQCARQLCRAPRLSRSSYQTLGRIQVSFRRTYATSVGAAELKFGQPLHETHPHILEPGERR